VSAAGGYHIHGKCNIAFTCNSREAMTISFQHSTHKYTPFFLGSSSTEGGVVELRALDIVSMAVADTGGVLIRS